MFSHFFDDESFPEAFQKCPIGTTQLNSYDESQLFFDDDMSNNMGADMKSLMGEDMCCSPMFIPEQESLIEDANKMMKFNPSEKILEEPLKGKKSRKNSNVIKKIGRMIIKNQHRYKLKGRSNEGAQKMMSLLEEKMKKKNIKDLIDGFNTEHLKTLFN